MDTSAKIYPGPKRRHFHRRQCSDRREIIRYEPDKKNRRTGLDRRSVNNLWNGRMR